MNRAAQRLCFGAALNQNLSENGPWAPTWRFGMKCAAQHPRQAQRGLDPCCLGRPT